MEKIDHLHPLMIVELTLVEVTPARADRLNGRHLPHIVIDLLQLTAQEVLHDLFGAALALAQEEAVNVVNHLLGMQHRGDAASHDQLAPLVILVGNLPSTLHLS